MTDTSLDYEAQLAQIARAREETRKFVEEQHKLRAEASKMTRDRDLAVWQIGATLMAAGAALFGAGAAFIKLIG